MNFKTLKKWLVSAFIALFITTGAVSVKAEDYGNPYWGGYGNCTWSAWQLAYENTGVALPQLGSATNWYYSAASYGYTVSNVPQAGSIIVWSGHVGYVSAVSEDGNSVYVLEGGYCGGYHEGWWPAYSARNYRALIGYIYLW